MRPTPNTKSRSKSALKVDPNGVALKGATKSIQHLTEWLTSLQLNTAYPSTRPAVSLALSMLYRVSGVERVAPIKLLNELIRILHSERSAVEGGGWSQRG